jgi:diketogulonate reductase-like aldo/keto reductase
MLPLSSGYDMPALGLGTSSILEVTPFISAIKNGYRHLDTAKRYSNEHLIGEAIQVCIQEGVVNREDLFITTKLWHDNYDSPEDALRLGLEKLQTSYVDLYLIHWPNNGMVENKVPLHILWEKMEVLV